MVLAGACSRDDPRDAVQSSSTSAAPTTSTSVAPVGGLLAEVEVNRLYALDRALGVALHNVGSEPVTVRSVRLDSPLFESAEPSAREVVLTAGGRRLVVPAPYGPARCEDAAATFTIVMALADGQELRIPAVERYDGSVGRMHARECAAAAVTESVELRLGETWSAEGSTVTGELILEQRSPGTSARLEQTSGSVIFAVRTPAGRSPILAVDDDQPIDRTEITISAQRCDPHALGESKRTFVFPVWISLDDQEAVAVELVPTGPSRAALDQLLLDCQR